MSTHYKGQVFNWARYNSDIWIFATITDNLGVLYPTQKVGCVANHNKIFVYQEVK